ncbi:unknown (plasmid) [Crocosphaera subtropica ATCC 51142]|uniref:Uncharacterized protein n=1 Tax=Crocosphaera subtropica (strain ATCC 51142 / BH68) TaxID=43989 RepID=B1X395_CROS5|nr:unknown [Crocosphaera subtropica ATCC 51142]
MGKYYIFFVLVEELILTQKILRFLTFALSLDVFKRILFSNKQ